MNKQTEPQVAAVVLAAGASRRMGRCKLTLPWGNDTVIGAVVTALATGGAAPIVVVTGAWADEVQRALTGRAVLLVHNPRHTEDAMLLSLQAGLNALRQTSAKATLVALGDMPTVPAEVISALLTTYRTNQPHLLIPSYRRRRGHPWLVDRRLWDALLALQPPTTLRDFLHQHTAHIHYLEVDTPTILQDLDTPQDYQRYQNDKPRTTR